MKFKTQVKRVNFSDDGARINMPVMLANRKRERVVKLIECL